MHRWEGQARVLNRIPLQSGGYGPYEIPRNKTTKKGINQILSVFGEMKIKKKIRRRGNPAIRVLSAPVTHDAICIEMKKKPCSRSSN